MRLPICQFRRGHTGARGFTLMEILIVAALIALFSGIAVFAVREMYIRNQKKAMIGAASQLVTALSFAHHDLGFYPRINTLQLPLNRLEYRANNAHIVRPAMDTYGFLLFGQQLYNLTTNWRGPYMPISSSRGVQAGSYKNVVKMRLPDQQFQNVPTQAVTYWGEDPTLVDWPADAWGQPFVVYQITADPAFVKPGNPKGLRFIRSPNEKANYFSAVVSYGPNKFPGCGEEPSAVFSAKQLESALYVKEFNNPADYTLKCINTTNAAYRIDEDAELAIIQSLENLNITNPEDVGVRDPGSDDIIKPL